MIKERIQSKGDDLKMLQGHDRLAYLIDIAKDVESLPQEVKIEQNRIRGNPICWLAIPKKWSICSRSTTKSNI